MKHLYKRNVIRKYTTMSSLPLYLEGANDEKYTISCCDEVGRGPGCGPVCVAAVIWDSDYIPENDEDERLLNSIKDSKKLSEKKRIQLSEFITRVCKDYAIACVDNHVIDDINILQATFKCMHNALDKLNTDFDKIYVDGNRFKPYMNKNGDFIPHTCVVKGDNQLLGIAAASILAKVYRDNSVVEYFNSDRKYQPYAWDKNKGYLTKTHIDAIKKFGITDYHRKTFLHFL